MRVFQNRLLIIVSKKQDLLCQLFIYYFRQRHFLIQEIGDKAKTIESKVDELAQLPEIKLTEEECEQIAEIGNNKGCMNLKGANSTHTGAPEADHWPLRPELIEAGQRWSIDPQRDLACTHAPAR